MNSVLKSFKNSSLVHLGIAIIFFTSGLLINIVQCLLYCTLRPMNKSLYRKINWYLDYSLYSYIVFVGEWWSGSQVIIYTNDENLKFYGNEHAYVIMNHCYETDWVLGWILLERVKVLGNAKAYCKKAIKYMPILGWAWHFSEFVFLERNYQKDKQNIHLQVTELANYPYPMWLILYPEGTRFTEIKHKASLEYSRQHNLPELKYHLLPRTRGFIASIPAIRGKVPALYDTLAVFKENDVEPTIRNLLIGKSMTSHIYITRIPLENIPEDEKGQDKFLIDLFVKKDKMKESFLKSGDFFKLTDYKEEVKPVHLPRRTYTLINVLVWSSLILFSIMGYLLKLLLSGQIILFTSGIGIISIFYFLFNRILSMGDIKNASTYGIKDKKEQ